MHTIIVSFCKIFSITKLVQYVQSIKSRILFHWRLEISGNLNRIIFVKWNAPKLQSVFSQHFSVLPCKLSLGEKEVCDEAKKAKEKTSDSQGARSYIFFGEVLRKNDTLRLLNCRLEPGCSKAG